MLYDAFIVIARAGAGTIEVALWLQKALRSLASLDYPGMADVAKSHAQFALRYAEKTLTLKEEKGLLKKILQYFETE